MISCTRRIQFCAGHRVMRHEGKCAQVHGHNYVAFITAEGINADLDDIGRVIDFSVIKAKVGGWIEKRWDHKFIVCGEDTELREALDSVSAPYYSMTNPTAENMADFLLRRVCPIELDGLGVTATRVVLWETENCYAEVVL